MDKKEELWGSFDKCLSEEDNKVLKSVTPKECNDFLNSDVDLNESYFVLGNERALKIFKILYKIRAFKMGYVSSDTFMISDYVDTLMNKSEENLLGREKDILFLYIHVNMVDHKNAESWIIKKSLDKITNRKRNGYVTIVLSEKGVSEMISELPLINLSKSKVSFRSNNVSELKESNNVDCDGTVF